MDGVIIIGTELDTKLLKTKLKELDRELKTYEKEEGKLNVSADKSRSDIAEMEAGLELLKKQHEEELQTLQTEEAKKLAVEGFNRFLEASNQAIEQEKKNLDGITRKLEENKGKQDLVKQKIRQTNEELKKATGFEKMSGAIKDVGKELTSVVKKVGLWALALLGIKSIYGFIKSSIGTITQYNEKLGNDLDYMRYALAMSIKPLVEWLIQAFYKLLTILGYVVKQITGKNMFDNAGASQFNKDINKASKSAKELKNQLSGFDEINIISDNTSTSGGGGATPTVDLKKAVDDFKPEDTKKIWDKISSGINKARKSLKDYQKEISKTVMNIGGLESFYGKWSTLIFGIELAWKGLVDIFAGVWDTLEGLFGMIIDVITGDWDALKEHFIQFITGLWEIIKGAFELAISSFTTVIGIIRGIVQSIWDWLIDRIKKGLGIIWDWIQWTADDLAELISKLWEGIKNGAKSFWEFIKNIPTNIYNAFKGAVDKIGNAFSTLWSKIKSGLNTIKTAVNNFITPIKNGVKGFINLIIDGMNVLIRGLNKISFDVPDWVPLIGGKKWGFNIREIPRLAQGGIVDNPSKGVMMGSYIAGESGREGILPLTNPTTMAELGQEIGKWVNIAIDNRMVVDGRVLATATNNQINKENFLMNR